MGQTLSEPVTDKNISSGGNDSVLYAVSDMQGWRISMEDAHATILDIKDAAERIVGNFFGVYDGHGGSATAQFCGRNLHKTLIEHEKFKAGEYTEALEKAFILADEQLLGGDPDFFVEPSGCTAVTCFIKTNQDNPKKIERVFCANAGDSRCVLSRAGLVLEMSTDHKPTLDSERSRIEAAGGYVSWGRVNGNLALSRAIGDFEFKRSADLPVEKQIVTAVPEIMEQDVIEAEDEFLVLACDGIWECLSSQDVVDVVRRSVANGKELEDICKDLMDRCLAPNTGGIGCDNMTVCVVALLNGRSKEEWYSWIKENIDVPKNSHTTPQDVPAVFKNTAPSSRGQDGDMDGTVSIQSLLSGGLARGEDDEEGGGALRLPGGLAGALSGAGIVFRPGQRSEDGEVVYEAHVVDEEDSDEQSESSGIESKTATSSGAQEPEIVDSPRQDAKAASSARDPENSDKMEVDNESETAAKTQSA